MATSEWKWFSLDTNLYTGMIKSEEDWKKCVEVLKDLGTFEQIKLTRDDDGIGAPFPTFSFRESKGFTLEEFFKERNMEIDPK